MNIETKNSMVFVFDNKYYIGISKKKNDGEWENSYFPIEFNKGVEIPNKTMISIKNAWLSFYKWEYNGKKGTKFFIKCSDYEIVQKSEEQTSNDPKNSNDIFKDFGESIEINEEELPF